MIKGLIAAVCKVILRACGLVGKRATQKDCR